MFVLPALLLALSGLPAFAGPIGPTRDVQGQLVDLDAPGTVLAFWRLDCLTCAAEMRALAHRGARVVAVNLDGAQAQSQLLPWMRRHRLEVPVLADPTGALWARFGTTADRSRAPRAAEGLAIRKLDPGHGSPKPAPTLASRPIPRLGMANPRGAARP